MRLHATVSHSYTPPPRAKADDRAQNLVSCLVDYLQTNGGWCPRGDADLQPVADGEDFAVQTVHGPERNGDALVSTHDGLMQQPQGVTDVAVVA